ncbi:MAG: hypothetical protein ABIB43_05685 [archaeon]
MGRHYDAFKTIVKNDLIPCDTYMTDDRSITPKDYYTKLNDRLHVLDSNYDYFEVMEALEITTIWDLKKFHKDFILRSFEERTAMITPYEVTGLENKEGLFIADKVDIMCTKLTWVREFKDLHLFGKTDNYINMMTSNITILGHDPETNDLLYHDRIIYSLMTDPQGKEFNCSQSVEIENISKKRMRKGLRHFIHQASFMWHLQNYATKS